MIDIVRHRPIRTSPLTEKPNASNAAVYARYSSDLQDKTSIDGQVRKAMEWSEINGLILLEKHCFADEAVSGTIEARPGLDRMLIAAERKEFSVLIVESLSRLARSHVYASTVMMQLVYVLKIRIVGIDDGCDTNNPGWELLAGIKNILNEQYIRDLGKMVYRGQIENLMQGFSIGDLCFGYTSQPIPGEHRNAGHSRKVKMHYVIDEEQAFWVRRIFHWFVQERKPIRRIAEELTRLGAPKDRRSTIKEWSHAAVKRLLSNKKYVGIWTWGKKRGERNPIDGKVRQVKRSDEEISKYTRSFPELRLIGDTVFEQAQELLRANHANFRPKDGDSSNKRSVSIKSFLSNLARCGRCGGPYQSVGGNSPYMFCRNSRLRGTCNNRTLLKSSLAERLILQYLDSEFFKNEDWIEAILVTARDYAQTASKRVTDEWTQKTKQVESLRQKIERLLDWVENGKNFAEIEERLVRRRSEKTRIERELLALRSGSSSISTALSVRWIRERLGILFENLGKNPTADNRLLHQLLEEKIVVSPISVPGKKRSYLRGVLRMCSGRFLSLLLDREHSGEISGTSKVLTIDFRDDFHRDRRRRRAIELFEKGALIKEIAQEMQVSANSISKLIKEECRLRGERSPNLRKRTDRRMSK